MPNHDNAERAEFVHSSAAPSRFDRNELDGSTSWMINEAGADTEACRTAVSDDRDRIARRLNDDVIRGMFGVGLRLQATAQLADGTVQARLELAIHDLDLIIAEVRSVIFDHNSSVHLSSDD